MSKYSRQFIMKMAAGVGLSAFLGLGAACKSETTVTPPDPIPTPPEFQAQEISQPQNFFHPWDAAPSADGSVVFFAAGTPRGAVIMRNSAQGGTPTVLHEGDPLASPFSLMPSQDGATVFVADPAAEGEEEDAKPGRLWAISAAGGAPSSLASAEGLAPRSLDVVTENSAEFIYFTGTTEAGVPALFKMGTDGSGLTVVLEGDPLKDPSGVAVAQNGDIYVADYGADDSQGIVRIRGGQATVFVRDLRLGFPAGIALNLAESSLFASGLDPETGTAVVYAVDLAAGTVATQNQGIAQNTESAGVHRAKNAEIFAWADAAGDNKSPAGKVYLITFK